MDAAREGVAAQVVEKEDDWGREECVDVWIDWTQKEKEEDQRGQWCDLGNRGRTRWKECLEIEREREMRVVAISIVTMRRKMAFAVGRFSFIFLYLLGKPVWIIGLDKKKKKSVFLAKKMINHSSSPWTFLLAV